LQEQLSGDRNLTQEDNNTQKWQQLPQLALQQPGEATACFLSSELMLLFLETATQLTLQGD